MAVRAVLYCTVAVRAVLYCTVAVRAVLCLYLDERRAEQENTSMRSREILRLNAICRLRPLDAVLSSGLCGKEGALPHMTGKTVKRIICC